LDIANAARTKTHPLFITREMLREAMLPDDYVAAVEAAFRAHAEGRTSQPMPLHIAVAEGGFHAKGAYAALDRGYVAVKVNSNFPGNPARGLPTIQGAVLLYDANDGTLLAILDSSEITSKRTAAASALAARYLARRDAATIAICGCGEQGRAQLAALARQCALERAFAWDADAAKAREFAQEMAAALGIEVAPVKVLRDATLASDIIVTATSSGKAFLTPDCVRAGTFIAAVGADSPHKSEIDPALFGMAKVVVDSLDQAAAMGDLHHAIAAGTTTRASVHAELADVVVGRVKGRAGDAEITLFDSTGMAIQDVGSAAVAYARLMGTSVSA
jgi:ornithine cyclodeaminase/alanine dehydrogenase-like protein (mu-crystallin family)